MQVRPVELFDPKPYERPGKKTHTTVKRRRKRPTKVTESQTHFLDAALVAQDDAKRAYTAWLKHSLREYPNLPEKIERLEQLAAGTPVTPVTRVKARVSSRHTTNLLTDQERYLAEVIRATMPDAFHRQPIGLLTSGRFRQQVRTLMKEPDLRPLLERFLDARDVEYSISPIERTILHQEQSREYAARMARELKLRKEVFDIALEQLETYQPESYELLRLRYLLQFSAVKVMMELEFESESTYADHLRDALKWLSRHVNDARELVKQKTPQF